MAVIRRHRHNTAKISPPGQGRASTPPVERARHAGGAGKGHRQTAQAAHREIGESLRLQRIGRPADRVGAFDTGRRQALGEYAHQRRIARAAAGRRSSSRGGLRQMRHDAGDRGRGEGGERRRAVLDPTPSMRIADPAAESVAIERFRRRHVEITDGRADAATAASSHAPAAAHRAVAVDRPAGAQRASNRRSAHCPGRYRRRSARCSPSI